jgi:hypothetical protein
MSVRARPAEPGAALPPLRRGGHTLRILLVGAYERDNLGDLLFLLVTERYVAEAEVVAAAPFAADMRALLDRRVHASGPLLRDEPWDVVWTVGGQLGSIDLRRAYRLSAAPDALARFDRANPLTRARILRRAVGGVRVEAPYIPDLTGSCRSSSGSTRRTHRGTRRGSTSCCARGSRRSASRSRSSRRPRPASRT